MHPGDLLSAYVDDQLSAADAKSVRDHLADCADCRRELAAVTDVRNRVRSLPLVEPPPDLYEGGADVVPLHRTRRTLVAAAAAVALVVGVGFGVNGNQAVPLELNQVVEQHVARASVDPGFNVLQVQAVANR